jgi:hypothetical protein
MSISSALANFKTVEFCQRASSNTICSFKTTGLGRFELYENWRKTV